MPDSDGYEVLISCPLIFGSIDEYHDILTEYEISYTLADVDQRLSESKLLETLPGYHGILAGDDELTAQVIEACPELRVISKWGVGTDGINSDAAAKHGVQVFNTPGAFSAEVADVVIGYTLMLTRHLHKIDREVRRGIWYCPRGVSLAGKTFGIIGVGNIGSAVARRAAVFDMDVLGHDVQPIPYELRNAIDIESVGREELLHRCDVVSLNCNLNDETAGMIDKEALELIGSAGYLINTSRGGLVVEEHLIAAIEQGTIAGAALDVFESEPLPSDSPLIDLENVLLGTHNAQNTEEAVRRVNDRAVANLVEGLTGDRPMG